MNIKITHNWLLEYLETDATPDEIRNYLSLCGPSIESVIKTKDNDFVYDIEIISNRIDYASVTGIAQEAVAILPMFGKKAKLIYNPLKDLKLSQIKEENKLNLKVEIKNPNLVSRFTALIFDNVKITSSPEYIKNRLTNIGIKVINNVVDISNYLMISLGQPIHMFDYDKIGKQKMIVRESRKDEKLITLDNKEITLPGGDIVIEDGNGNLIDLCGIMGGKNSAIDNNTKRVVLFVQTYNKVNIRKTTMTTGQRTLAATFFEKGLDEERVAITTVKATELMEKLSQAKVVSQIQDIYPNKYVPTVIKTTFTKFNEVIGITIEKQKIISILESLGFITNANNDELKVSVPSYRKYDVIIEEDLVEEVARIYGYHNIPSILQSPAYVEQPKEMEDLFVFQNKIKTFLKHLGLNEVINYSMISKKMIEEFNLDPKSHLRLSNSLSVDIEYLRISLFPSIYKNIKDNQGKKDILKLFEIGKVYLPIQNNLPNEVYKLTIATNTDYFDLKGIITALFKELNINTNNYPKIIEKNNIFITEIDFQSLINSFNPIPNFKPITPFSIIKLDKTFEINEKQTYLSIKEKTEKSKLLQKIDVISLFKNKLTLRFYYSSSSRNITEEEAKKDLDSL